jgi:hypothetical protein
MNQWLHLATRWSVVRRALGYAVVVGAILIGINHGDAILAGSVDASHTGKMLLTTLVPYCVSTLSSVAAVRTAMREHAAKEPSPNRRA